MPMALILSLAVGLCLLHAGMVNAHGQTNAIAADPANASVAETVSAAEPMPADMSHLQQQVLQLTRQVEALRQQNQRLQEQLGAREQSQAAQAQREADQKEHNRQMVEAEAAQNRLQHIRAEDTQSAFPPPGDPVILEASEVVAAFDESEEKAKARYSSQPIRIHGSIKEFVYDPVSVNKDLIMIVAQSPGHQLAVSFTGDQLSHFRNLQASSYQMTSKIRFEESVNAVVAVVTNISTSSGKKESGNARYVPLLKVGSFFDAEARFDAIDGASKVVNFIAE